MTDKEIQTVAFVGFADAYGEGWVAPEFSKIAEARKLKIVASERYQRNDTSVTGQVLKIMAAKPDAVPDRRCRNPGRPAAESASGKGLQGD